MGSTKRYMQFEVLFLWLLPEQQLGADCRHTSLSMLRALMTNLRKHVQAGPDILHELQLPETTEQSLPLFQVLLDLLMLHTERLRRLPLLVQLPHHTLILLSIHRSALVGQVGGSPLPAVALLGHLCAHRSVLVEDYSAFSPLLAPTAGLEHCSCQGQISSRSDDRPHCLCCCCCQTNRCATSQPACLQAASFGLKEKRAVKLV